MATTTASNPTTPEPEGAGDRLRAAFARLTNSQKILLMVAIATVVALVVASNTWLQQADYRVLFSNISERDGGAIIASLEQMNVPYRFNDSGTAILVPSAKVHEARLRLATQGLPKGGGVGFELMENQKFGISQFAEQVNYQRGLEGELARTIQSISAVQTARVHLAIPKPTVFVREEQKPSASVLLNLYAGRTLDAAQVAGIQNLVAASVPNLAVSAVTVVDQNGAMVSQLKTKLMEAGLDPTQITYVHEIETSVIKRIDDILLPILGRGNAHVQVAADVDFSQNEQTAETHRPNTTPPDISIRSQQTSESASTSPSAQGVPGALSNQPPVPATAPLTQPAVPGATAGTTPLPVPGQVNAAGVQATINSVAQPLTTRKDSTVNYEVDKTIRHTREAVGTVKRLSAAVVVNHRKDAKGAVKPLSDPELKQINELVKEAMGFNKDRGDSVSVANAPFAVSDAADAELPIWKDPDNWATARELLKWAAIAAIVAYLVLKVILPLLKTMLESKSPRAHQGQSLGGNVNISDDEGSTEPAAVNTLHQKIDQARGIAQQDPKVVANIIKDWTNANAG